MTDVHAYCRAVEAHLCRRNGGHLIRIVGPAFDVVREWASAGIPLTVACAGIDRTAARVARRAGRPRPLRVEFCAADVFDTYDEWARAVGSAGIPTATTAVPPVTSRRSTLGQHIDRVVAQLSAIRDSQRGTGPLGVALETTLTALDGLRATASAARGAARERLVADLSALDTALTAAALESVGATGRAEARRDAEAELAAYRGRLSAAQWEAAAKAASTRLVRLRLGLPQVGYE
ncbi:MAG: hypothetical protein AB7U83_24440 [Vicinamibacterales bacterium]